MFKSANPNLTKLDRVAQALKVGSRARCDLAVRG
jgi:hypothetical protein